MALIKDDNYVMPLYAIDELHEKVQLMVAGRVREEVLRRVQQLAKRFLTRVPIAVEVE